MTQKKHQQPADRLLSPFMIRLRAVYREQLRKLKQTNSLLARAELWTIRQLRGASILRLESAGFSPTPLQEVRAKLAEYGLSLTGEQRDRLKSVKSSIKRQSNWSSCSFRQKNG